MGRAREGRSLRPVGQHFEQVVEAGHAVAAQIFGAPLARSPPGEDPQDVVEVGVTVAVDIARRAAVERDVHRRERVHHAPAGRVVLAGLVDVDDKTLRYLLDEASDAQPFTAYRSSYNGLPEPLCALYRPGSDAIVRRFVEDGVVCPRKILINSDTQLLDQPNPSALENVNTPDDLADSVLEVAS